MLVKEAASILMKFQKKEYLQQLQAGHMYMKSLQWYIDEEKRSKVKFISDDMEAKARAAMYNLKMINKSNDSVFLEFPKGDIVYSEGYEKKPVFCFFNFDERNCTEENLKGNKLEWTMEFSDEQKRELLKFGDSVLVVKDKFELFARIDKAMNRENLEYVHDDVTYYNEKNSNHLIDVLNRETHIAFSKREQYFKLQQEYRLMINKNVSDHYILDIGDLSDITEITDAEQILNTKLLATCTLTE